MSGDTHAAVGAAVAAVSLSATSTTHSVTEVAIILVASVIGALFPDLDLGNSKGSKMLNKALKVIIPVLIIGYVCVRIGFIKRNRFSLPSLGAFCLFLLVGVFARTRPHREFTHSITVLVGTMFLVSVAFGVGIGFWYALGYASHLAVDLLNNKGESLLWPSKFKLCFKVCSANGSTNSIIKVTACCIAVVCILTLKIGGV